MNQPPEQAQNPAPAPPLLRACAAVAAAWAAWWLMMASHEVGHILTGLFTGAQIDRIDLSPIGFSQTHLAHNPRPLLVVWAGPVFGVVDALLTWALVTWWARRDPEGLGVIKPAAEFLAGFCLIANGAYIGLGWLDHIGDTGVMMRHGTPIAVMVGFGVVCAALGLLAWHRLGPGLGLKRLPTAGAKQVVVPDKPHHPHTD